MSSTRDEMVEAIAEYATQVRTKRSDPGHSPETSLYSDLEGLLSELAETLSYDSTRIVPQYQHADVGAPDFAVKQSSSTGYLEAKEPDTSLGNLAGRDRKQFEKYIQLGNILYTNYHQLRLFQDGELVGKPVELVPKYWLEPSSGREFDRSDLNIARVENLLLRFFEYTRPNIRGIEELAVELAHATSLVRDAVEAATELAEDEDEEDSSVNGPLEEIYREFRDVLFHELSRQQFADAYAQTLAYGLLLIRQSTDSRISRGALASYLEPSQHKLLSSTLRLLSQPPVLDLVGWTVENLIGVVNQVDSKVLQGENGPDPLLYFYEDFLAQYDPSLRKERGVYYTPPEVVNCQTRVIDQLLTSRFSKRYGFADESVKTLDPGVGTGTYLASALEQGVQRIREAIGESSVPDAVPSIASRLHGFEILVGPYTVAHFRLSAAVQDEGGEVEDRLPIVLTNTLLPPGDQPEVPTRFGFMSEPLNDERERADHIKREEEIMVVLGNPPYQRRKSKSGWLWDTLMEDFKDPVRDEYAGDFKNLSERSIWFHRWAHWKLFESDGAPDRGILSFISNRSYLIGGAFGGMRKMYRDSFDTIYIIDLHGDVNAPLPANVDHDENIFAIKVGVAICVCIADGSQDDEEADVYYYGDTWGRSEDKLEWLKSVDSKLNSVPFERVDESGTSPFVPGLSSEFESWPHLKEDVFEFSMTGVQTKRDALVVAPTASELASKITEFLSAPVHKQKQLFNETRDTKMGPAAKTSFNKALIKPYGYRPLDRQYLYDHPAFVEYNRADSLQRVWGETNLALVTMPSGHGAGPAAFLHKHLPDMVSFRGSYTTHVFPLWNHKKARDSEQIVYDDGPSANISKALLNGLGEKWGTKPAASDTFAYIYAVLSAPSYTTQYSEDLAQSYPRIPFPREYETYERGVKLGAQLVDLHTFERRYPADGSIQIGGSGSRIDSIEYEKSEQRILLSDDTWVSPVSEAAWDYQISGYEVIRRWIEHRKESNFNIRIKRELLDLIWAVEETVDLGSDLDAFLNHLVGGATVAKSEIGLE